MWRQLTQTAKPSSPTLDTEIVIHHKMAFLLDFSIRFCWIIAASIIVLLMQANVLWRGGGGSRGCVGPDRSLPSLQRILPSVYFRSVGSHGDYRSFVNLGWQRSTLACLKESVPRKYRCWQRKSPSWSSSESRWTFHCLHQTYVCLWCDRSGWCELNSISYFLRFTS